MSNPVVITQKTVPCITVQHGRISITAELHSLGEDFGILIYGGSKPHIGTVTLTIPRPSMKTGDTGSATTSVLNVVGHKDDEAARFVSHAVSAASQKTIAVACGIHVDHISDEEIKIVFDSLQIIVDYLIGAISGNN